MRSSNTSEVSFHFLCVHGEICVDALTMRWYTVASSSRACCVSTQHSTPSRRVGSIIDSNTIVLTFFHTWLLLIRFFPRAPNTWAALDARNLRWGASLRGLVMVCPRYTADSTQGIVFPPDRVRDCPSCRCLSSSFHGMKRTTDFDFGLSCVPTCTLHLKSARKFTKSSAHSSASRRLFISAARSSANISPKVRVSSCNTKGVFVE